jgi:hypothetical protein
LDCTSAWVKSVFVDKVLKLTRQKIAAKSKQKSWN